MSEQSLIKQSLSDITKSLSDITNKQLAIAKDLATRINIVAGVLVLVVLATIPDSPVVKALQGVATKLLTG